MYLTTLILKGKENREAVNTETLRLKNRMLEREGARKTRR